MLQSVGVFPPIPVVGDFVYGEGQAAITLPLSGNNHTRRVLELDVELELVGCPAELPACCRDGSCAVDEAACGLTSPCPESSSCFPNCPQDGDILSCMYENSFDAGAITDIDYPESEGWTEADALANCSAIAGANNPRIVRGGGQSSLVKQGGNAFGRCIVSDNDRRYYHMDVGETVCNFISGAWEATGPSCEGY